MRVIAVGGRAKEGPVEKITALDEGDIALLKSYVCQAGVRWRLWSSRSSPV